MDEQQPRQKQISQRYDGAADYPRSSHYFRRLRAWLFVLAVVISVLGSLAFSFLGKQNAYSPGPISQSHARFASDCRACHHDADGVLPKLSRLAPIGLTPAGTGGSQAPAWSAIARMDEACLHCHSTAGLHLPQAANLGARAVSSELTVVHATGCAVCHREHIGRDRLALPSQQSCVSCHNDATALSRARAVAPLGHQPVAPASDHSVDPAGDNRDLGDGVVRFLASERKPGALPTFASFAQGHPDFAYKQPGMRDPAILKFNHERHLRKDIAKVYGHDLNCTDCHKPGPGDVFMQPVKYERHCAECHTLQFQPNLPKLRIPHGDPEKVRYFLVSRETSFRLALQAEGVRDPDELEKRVRQEMDALRVRISDDLATLEKRVFFEGDPPGTKNAPLARSSDSKFLTECFKCHPKITPGDASHAPAVQRPNMAERWLEHGPFTHLPHQRMNCVDCHGAALKSTLTSDILLPAQKICAECHRAPLESEPAETATAPHGNAPALATAQRIYGGVKWDCTSCHDFHAPPDAQAVVKSLAPAANSAGGALRR